MNEKIDVAGRLISSSTMSVSKKAARQHEDIRKKILKALANGGIRQSVLMRMIPDANRETVRSIIASMQKQGQLQIIQVDGWNMVTLPIRIENVSPRELRIEPILPKMEPILPVIKPLEREAPGVFVQDSPERLVLRTLGEGPRMRDSLVRLVAGQISSDEANRLLDRMIKSGIIAMTRNGRLSLVRERMPP